MSQPSNIIATAQAMRDHGLPWLPFNTNARHACRPAWFNPVPEPANEPQAAEAPHMAGWAFCNGCQHRWTAVTPVGQPGPLQVPLPAGPTRGTWRNTASTNLACTGTASPATGFSSRSCSATASR